MFKYNLRGKVHRDVERQLTLIIDKAESLKKAVEPLLQAQAPQSASSELLKPIVTPLLGDPSANDPILRTLGLQSQGIAVANSTGAGDVVAQLNALLASLRAAGVIAA